VSRVKRRSRRWRALFTPAAESVCGRFSLTHEIEAVADAFRAETAPGLTRHRPRHNIAPTEDAPIVIAARGARRAGLMRWGLVPHWAENPRVGARMINARSETVGRRSAFRESFLARRCLVPADGFYEWESRPSGKQPYWLHLADRDVFAMAGIWSSWRSGTGSRLLTFSVLTRDAPEALRWLHDRVPVILPPNSWDDWLARGTTPAALHAILGDAEPPDLDLHPVSRAVNRAGYDERDCVARVETDDLGLFM